VSVPKVAMPVCKWQFVCVPVLMWLLFVYSYPKSLQLFGNMRKYTPLRYSKITIFATACRFSIQTIEQVAQKGAAVLR